MASQDCDLVKKMVKCANFAAEKHKDQRRKDSNRTPYINHPVGVAYILTEEAGIVDLAVIQAALLHDTVEDTNTTPEEIAKEFGQEVKDLVAEVTDDKSLPKKERKDQQILHAPNCSYKAKLVKLADKLYNLRDLNHSTPVGWSEQRVHEYFAWSAKVIDGLRGTNKYLEETLDELLKARNVI